MVRLDTLVLENCRQDADLSVAMLRQAGYEVQATVVESKEQYLAALRRGGFSLFLIDYNLCGFSGLEAIQATREHCPDAPVIIVSSSIGEEVAVDLLKAGATDYVLKHRPERLVPVVRRALREQEERSRRTEAEAKLRESGARLRALAKHLLVVREEERTHLAREVHDRLSQSLTTLALDLGWLERRLGGEGATLERVREMQEIVRETIGSVRQVCAELRPGPLDELGLVASVEILLRDFEVRTGVRCQLRLDLEGSDPDRAVAVPVYRILQEALANVARHSGAGHVTVELRSGAEGVELSVCDDGCGISQVAMDHPRSFGLLGMRERAELFGGTFAIGVADESGRGTRLHVRLPTQIENQPVDA